MIKNRTTYEIMDPHEVGWGDTELPLTKHSGRAAMVQRLAHLGHERLAAGEIDRIFERFKEVGDRKKFVYDDDLAALVEDSASGVGQAETYELEYIHVTSGTTMVPTATVRVRKSGPGSAGAENGGETRQDSAPGNGAVDAAMKAIDRVLGREGHLAEYHVQAVTGGQDALAEVTLKVDFGDSKLITGRGASTDVIEASARAYLHAVGRVLAPSAPKAAAEIAADTPVSGGGRQPRTLAIDRGYGFLPTSMRDLIPLDVKVDDTGRVDPDRAESLLEGSGKRVVTVLHTHKDTRRDLLAGSQVERGAGIIARRCHQLADLVGKA